MRESNKHDHITYQIEKYFWKQRNYPLVFSTLGPSLENKLFDDLFFVKMSNGCILIGVAGDVGVIVTAKKRRTTYECGTSVVQGGKIFRGIARH